MRRILITNAKIVNRDSIFESDILIAPPFIERIDPHITDPQAKVIDAAGLLVFPGVIDDQVHFREPGLTHKADIHTESRAALAGGITSFMEMPNTVPQAVTLERLEEKYQRAAERSPANYSFYMGSTNDNAEEIRKVDPVSICGVKIFMGASTGNMLVDDEKALEAIFSGSPVLIATHCEDEATIRRNSQQAREQYGEEVPVERHPLIRSEEACYLSSTLAVSLAKKYDADLHVLHISTARELALFDGSRPLQDKKITAEACIHHLWFTDADYASRGTLIKWNPAVKRKEDRDAIRRAVEEGVIDIVATDHAPHTLEEKRNTYFKAPSGGPLVQHALVAMLEMARQGVFSLETIARTMSHHPALRFRIDRRGFVDEGYYADLAMVHPDRPWQVSQENIMAKCGWSPFEGNRFNAQVVRTLVNGHVAFEQGKIMDDVMGMRLRFNR